MKKITNIYLRLVAVCLCVLALTACVEDEISGAINVVEGKPVTVSFDFSAVQGKDIVVTRAADNSYSTLHGLAIFVYSGDGSIFQQLVTTSDNTLTLSNRNTTGDPDGVRYTVEFKSTSGVKKLLAVANTSTTATDGGYWESLRTIAEDARNGNLTFDELKSSLISLRSSLYTNREMQPIQITSPDQMLMSGWNESVIFNTNGSVANYGTNVGDKDVILRLNRSMARITFNIPYTEYDENAEVNRIFTPTSYQVYNVPVGSWLGNIGEPLVTEGEDAIQFVRYAEENVSPVSSGNYTFTFYMPENVYPEVTAEGLIDYHDRDKWQSVGYEGALPEKKTWTYAPQTATFVVIKGNYEQTVGEDGTEREYTGVVEYTIHLGDFSPTGQIGNYSVERNCSYTYTVNVEDVNRIVVEAQKDSDTDRYQEGSEGAIYDYTQSNYAYHLDAHYEQVYLQYDLSVIANAVQGNEDYKNGDISLDQAIAEALVLTIQSEAMDYEHEETADEPYSVHNKQGTMKPYQIYVDAGGETNEANATAMKGKVLSGNRDGQSGFDYKWVEFWPQTGETIASYPGVSGWSRESLEGLANPNAYGGRAQGDSEYLKEVYDVSVAMGKAVRTIIDGESITTGLRNDDGIIITNTNPYGTARYVARFTAFVNEYYYYRHPLTGEEITSWSLFTNKMPREMIVAMSTDVSADGNSTYSELYSYISQLSIQTFYNSRVNSINGFGIETYNETPLCRWRKSRGSEPYYRQLTTSDGLWNQWNLIESNVQNYYSGPTWSEYIGQGYNGWTSPLTSMYTDHKLNSNAYQSNGEYAWGACMSRNRDLNGNGKIEENEVRWYLASLNEYIRMSIGAGAISNAAQLYKGDKMTMAYADYPINEVSNGSLYYTSSGINERVFWAVEQGSYSPINRWSEGWNTESSNERISKPIRCIRILPAKETRDGEEYDITSVSGVASDPTFESKTLTDGTTEIKFKDRLVDALYRERTNVPLNEHTEDDPENSFYDGIIVASRPLSSNYTLGNIVGYSGEKQDYPDGSFRWTYTDIDKTDPCATSYTEGGHSWRVPNLVELSAMNAALQPLDDYAGCCTRFSNIDVRHGFSYHQWISCPGPGDEGLNSEVKIRCVRDVPEGYFNE